MAASVVASVALPISNNFSFAPSMDAYGKLSEYGKLGAWSPLSLFAASEVGAWYDPSDLTTMFQDSAGTTPVTADGQPVGKILDKSGRGNHATQATAASRPLYKTDGTYHWLQFDGVDDSLSTAAINFTSTDKMSVFAGFVTTDNVGFDGIIQLGSVASGFFLCYCNTANLEFKVQGSSGVSAVNSAYTPASRSVLTSLMNLGGATGQNCLSTRKNASLFANASIVAGAANFQNGVMTIGGVTGVLLTGNIYSLIVRGALSTPQEITDTETWVNVKTGAY